MELSIDQQMTTSISSSNDDGVASVKDQIIDMICNNPDLPALGTSISSVIQITSSDESTLQLANLILSDVSLTQKTLRLANSACFRKSSGHAVTSISKAIQLLGLDTIKACALAMMLIEGMPKNHAKYVRYELELALSASLIGQKLSKRSAFPNTEEIAIVALFKNMGSLLVAVFDEKLYRETMALVTNGTHNKTQASLHTIGCSFDTLTEIAMQEWQIPNNIINAIMLLPSKTLVTPKNRQEWMQQAAEFSESAALLVLQTSTSNEVITEDTLLKQFGATLHLDQTQLDTLIVNVTNETRELNNLARLSPQHNNKNRSTDMDSKIATTDGLLLLPKHPSGKPYDAVEQLKIGVQNIAEITASTQYEINELVLKVLNVLYSSLGFHFATICLKDTKTNQFRARDSLGNDRTKIQKKFVFTDNSSDDIFNLALKRNIDLSISNTADPKMYDKLPRWHKKNLPNTKSFIILPLVINEETLGFIYADRQKIAPEDFSSDEMKLIKALKKQILTAFSSQSFPHESRDAQ